MVQLLPLRRRGETRFVTLALGEPDATTLVDGIEHLQSAVRVVRELWPFEVEAWVVLPDHLHALVTLPHGDADFAIRLSAIKARFAARVSDRALTPSQMAAGGTHLWRPNDKFEPVQNRAELESYRGRCRTDPVRHGFVTHPDDWPYASLYRDDLTDPRLAGPDRDIRSVTARQFTA